MTSEASSLNRIIIGMQCSFGQKSVSKRKTNPTGGGSLSIAASTPRSYGQGPLAQAGEIRACQWARVDLGELLTDRDRDAVAHDAAHGPADERPQRGVPHPDKDIAFDDRLADVAG